MKKQMDITDGRRTAAATVGKGIFLSLMLFLLVVPVPLLAKEAPFTVQLVPSTEQVQPGDTLQLAVRVSNDGWPDSGEAGVAAMQAAISYDHGKAVCIHVEFRDGTFGQYEDSTGLLTGFGESQSFGESLDYAVMTMQILDGAEGELAFSLGDLVLAEGNGTEIPGTAGAVIPITVGNRGSDGSGANGNDSGSGAAPGAVSSSGGGGRNAASGNTGSQTNGVTGGVSVAAGVSGSGGETDIVSDSSGEGSAGTEAGSNGENGTDTVMEQSGTADVENGQTGLDAQDGDWAVGEMPENGSYPDPGDAVDETASDPSGDHPDDSTGAGEASHAGGSTGKIRIGVGAAVLLAVAGAGLFIRKRKQKSS